MQAEFTVSTLRICVDAIKTLDSDIKGSICGIAVKDEMAFNGSSELFILIDRILDRIGRPQPSRQTRSFRESGENEITAYYCISEIYHTPEEIRKYFGSVMTRDVTFISRLRSSWQGIMWDELGNMIGEFESDLEFISLLYDRGVTGGEYNDL